MLRNIWLKVILFSRVFCVFVVELFFLELPIGKYEMQKPGTLYIVSTPIGNLDDITYRAVKILQQVDLIAAEDTRHSKTLLQHYGITTQLISLHEFNEVKQTFSLLQRLQKGEDLALISDAGTPLISDPGAILVAQLRDVGVNVVPIPGPCALVAALSAAGLPTEHFIFEGFLSAKSTKRLAQLKELLSEQRTMVFYEAPHRIMDFIKDIEVVFGKERKVVLAKELTKSYEAFVSGASPEIISWLQQDERRQKGEFVVLLKGAENDKQQQEISQKTSDILDLLLPELSVKKASELTAKITGEKKNIIYKAALEKLG
jgi:16S rRNA (cytidine1402-2'-O)-methyltransferase